ncbi:MFS transporter OS=Streptomyces microflavus OX=1919 GN=Smic_08440 PE=4 SV=1 [Streptomyces microflavus]
MSLQDLLRDVVEGRSAGDASNALLGAVQRGCAAGPMVRLQELVETSAQFASALETVQGRQVAGRLSALSRQIEFLTREVHEAAEDLGATVAVLPPHRTPVLRVRPRPSVDTSPPVPPPLAGTPARHR